MAHDIEIDDIMYSIDSGLSTASHTYFPAPRLQSTAHPFTMDELRAFELAGEHPGFD
jgi:hypothetical protein